MNQAQQGTTGTGSPPSTWVTVGFRSQSLTQLAVSVGTARKADNVRDHWRHRNLGGDSDSSVVGRHDSVYRIRTQEMLARS